MTKRILPWIISIAMVMAMIPSTAISAFAAGKDHGCKDKDDCFVCTVAEMINALPAAKNIDVNNAAAVVEQIHAIDRIKGDLSDDEYEEVIKLVEAGNDGSGYGVDVPTRYLEAVKAVNELDAGGSLYVQKKYSVGDAELDWSKTDAIVKIECLDKSTDFKPLEVTLSDITDSYLEYAGAYSANADGWTNLYTLPAGTYKITETGYHAVTEDGKKLATTVKYDIDGEETSKCAIVTIEPGQESRVLVYNSRTSAKIKAVASKKVGVNADGSTKYEYTYVKGAEINIVDPETGNVVESVLLDSESLDNAVSITSLVPGKKYVIKVIKEPNGYYWLDHDDYLDMHIWVEFDDETGESYTYTDASGTRENNTALIRFKKIDQYVIWLKDKVTIQYGESPSRIIDYDKSTLNDEEIPDDIKRILGTAFLFKFNGSEMYPSKAGEYEVVITERSESKVNDFKFMGTCKLTIIPKVIKKDDVIVSVGEDIDKKDPAKSLNIEFKEGVIKVKAVDREGNFIYDDVKAVFDAKLINKDGKQYIEYKINGLTGDDAECYVIEGDEISGSIVVEVTGSVTNTGDDFNVNLALAMMMLTLLVASAVIFAGRRRA